MFENGLVKYRNIALTVVFVSLVSYLIYHAISGERGVLALMQFTGSSQKLQTELDALRAERFGIEHKVTLMRSESLDLDILDEQARKVLGYAKGDETVYYIEKN